MNVIERLAKWFMGLLLGVFKVEWTEKQWTSFLQFIDYCVIGVLNVIVDYLVYAAAILLLRLTDWDGTFLGIPDCNVHLATVVAFIVMVCNSFYWNGRFTFADAAESAPGKKSVFVKVFFTYFIAVLVQLAANVLFRTVLGLPELLVNPIDQIITIPLTYVLNKYWSFK